MAEFENSAAKQPRVAIVGGGLAGLAAAVGLVGQGVEVDLFESRRRLGGRAGSFVDPTDGSIIDHCQHVAMGCCTNFLDFCRRTGTDGLLDRHRRLHFFGPDGERSDFEPSRWLPAPLHLAPALLGLRYLTIGEKYGIARTMQRLMRMHLNDQHDGATVLEWLRQQRQSERAIERFWKVVLVSALGESLDRASLVAARKVFFDGFWRHRDAANVWIPRVPLQALYDQGVAGWLQAHGARLHLGTAVEAIEGDSQQASGLRLRDGEQRPFEFVVVAVPWTRLANVLSAELLACVDPKRSLTRIVGAPISSAHLWFDRQITTLPHAVLVGRLSQWLFARSGERQAAEHYYQVVISASYELATRHRHDVVEQVKADLDSAFPLARGARLIRSRLITEQNAVISMRPGIESLRLDQKTTIRNLFVAGDWTQTGWPSTMEGAVRSGYLACEGILARLGRPKEMVVPELGSRA